MRKLFFVFLQAFILSACATNVQSTHVTPGHVDNWTTVEGVQYRLAQAYFDVSLEASQNQLRLMIDGPRIEPNPCHWYTLSFDKSRFEAAQFDVDVDPSTGLLRSITYSSDARTEEIAGAFGTLIGNSIALASSGVAVPPSGPLTPNSNTINTSLPVQGARSTILVRKRWRPAGQNVSCLNTGATDADRQYDDASFWDDFNKTIQQWGNKYEPARRFPNDLITVTNLPSNPATFPTKPPCEGSVCFSLFEPLYSKFQVKPITGGKLLDVAEPVDIGRIIELETLVPLPSSSGYLDIGEHGIADSAYQVVFRNGVPTYVATLDESPIESALNIPNSIIAGIGNGIVSILPIRVFINIQERELAASREGEGVETPTTVASGVRPSLPGSPTVTYDTITRPNDVVLNEPYTSSLTTIVLFSGAPNPTARGGTSANSNNSSSNNSAQGSNVPSGANPAQPGSMPTPKCETEEQKKTPGCKGS